MDYLKAVIIDYKEKGIIIDTNLLVLYIVGFYDAEYIEKFQRVKNKGYTKEDFEALLKLVSPFNKIFITPQILAEVSNLTFNDIKDNRFLEYFNEVLRIIGDIEEHHISKNMLLKMPMLSKFGFTDSSIMELAQKEDLPVITDDFPLYSLLINSGISAINMTHIRIYN
ncbi:MAG: hypothetical protein US63_C0005G0017 [Candidatus Moranbacteria bacterium GW2011_GWC2_37_8]|nr:MAG: hypothetical protein US63_C0005G0017 [Candidatus Moranbacteria bacterium GW2011_GWC2_37_8]KKQ62630.1 MAG: hypothetical protein US82_C0008G0012 [Parcubacteria group bacterium GW2011_GWC1_38_22]KKQ79459.1 MAG: hypothetical protein UT03_C0053G0004 [Candidatus Moranbacteria bacterium GW2011_GWD2_38_7]